MIDKPDALPFIMGAVVDFMLYLNEREQPIVVGKDYPNDKVIDTLQEWIKARNLDPHSDIQRPLWIQACEAGRFAGGENV